MDRRIYKNVAVFCITLMICVVNGCNSASESVISPVGGIICHSHNDYHHKRPLFDALSCGFRSVEADVFLVDGELLVGHSKDELSAGRTLELLYLEPLKERIGKKGGSVYGDGKAFYLMVDVKTDGRNVYKQLDKVLAGFSGVVSSCANGVYVRRAITVIISGDRAWDDIVADGTRYVGLDGRVKDLDSELGD